MNKITMLILTCCTASYLQSRPLPIEKACKSMSIIAEDSVLLILNEHKKSIDFQGYDDCTLHVETQQDTSLWHTLNSRNQNKIYNHKTDSTYELVIGDQQFKDSLSHHYLINVKKDHSNRFVPALMHAINRKLSQYY